MWFFILLILAAVIVLWWFIAKEFAQIAEMKGYTDSKYFWWTFWLGIVGILMVIALPVASKTETTVAPFELPEL